MRSPRRFFEATSFPQMRACLNGREETALFLYRWNSATLKIRNYDGETCLDLAAPYDGLCSELERLERIRKLSQSSSSSSSRHSTSTSSTGSAGNGNQKLRSKTAEFLKPSILLRFVRSREVSKDSNLPNISLFPSK